MDKHKLITAVAIGLLIVNIATLGLLFFNKPGRPHRPGDGPGGEGPKKIIIQRLHFDAAQQQAYELLVDDHRSRMFALNEASRLLHDELFTLLKSDQPDHSKASLLMEQIAANQKATDELNFDHFEKIKKLCRGSQLNHFNLLVDDLGALFSKGKPGR